VSGDCAADGTVALGENQAKTCTIVANDPPPVAGRSVNVFVKSGIVRIKLPGRRQKFRRLTEGEQIPLGTTIDTLRGRVTLVAAADNKGTTATRRLLRRHLQGRPDQGQQADRCKSTLTRVVRGKVAVRDFVTKKTIILRRGKRYIARAR
jgi:hypothetical protein